jgi:hypothetical protein
LPGDGGIALTSSPSSPNICDDANHVPERSLFRGLFKNPIEAVNPARPASPMNSRLLASPTRKWLKSQIIGR